MFTFQCQCQCVHCSQHSIINGYNIHSTILLWAVIRSVAKVCGVRSSPDFTMLSSLTHLYSQTLLFKIWARLGLAWHTSSVTYRDFLGEFPSAIKFTEILLTQRINSSRMVDLRSPGADWSYRCEDCPLHFTCRDRDRADVLYPDFPSLAVIPHAFSFLEFTIQI